MFFCILVLNESSHAIGEIKLILRFFETMIQCAQNSLLYCYFEVCGVNVNPTSSFFKLYTAVSLFITMRRTLKTYVSKCHVSIGHTFTNTKTKKLVFLKGNSF